MPTTEAPEILGLLSEPLRWQLISELGRSDRRVSELMVLVGKSQNLVSYHLAELRKAGVVSARRSSADARDIYYRADLLHCRDLLHEAEGSLHPGLRLNQLSRERSDRGTTRTQPRLLFLCTGNSARSQIAEALVEAHSHGTIEARSAGSHPKPLHPHAVRVMAERGIDISGRATKSLTRFARTRFDRIITLCDKVKEICPEFPGSPTSAHWSIADPAASGNNDEESYPAFQGVADEIDARVALLIADLRTEH